MVEASCEMEANELCVICACICCVLVLLFAMQFAICYLQSVSMLILGQPEPALIYTNAGPGATWADVRNRNIYK